MAFSVDGLVSGLDTTSIISQIMELERRPIRLLENKQVSLVDQKAAWQEVSTKLLAFEAAANAINTASEFASRKSDFHISNISNSGSVLSVTTGSDVSAGSYDLIVTQLAKAEKSSTSGDYTSSTAALDAAGTITINGTYSVTVTAADSLTDIRDNINNSGASATATIINTGTTGSPTYELVVTGDSTGLANAFSITNATDGTTNIIFSEAQAAQDAEFTIDGISVKKDSNTVSDVIDGATINLETIGSGTLTFANDTAGTIEKIQTFVDAYNEVTDYIKEQFTFNQTNGEKGALFGNVSLQTIQNQLRSIVSGGVSGIDYTDSTKLAYLSQVGIRTDDENHLAINTAELTDMLKDRFDEVQELFVPSGSGTYTFVSATGFTQGGAYSTRVIDDGSGGTEFQMQLSGTSDWITMTQAGNFVMGENDTILEGLILRTGSIAINDTGSMRVAVGVAQSAASYVATFTEYSTEGLIFNQNKSIESQDREIQDQIDNLEERIAKKEEDLRARFVTLETLLAKLTSEQSYLDSQLSNLSKGWK